MPSVSPSQADKLPFAE